MEHRVVICGILCASVILPGCGILPGLLGTTKDETVSEQADSSETGNDTGKVQEETPDVSKETSEKDPGAERDEVVKEITATYKGVSDYGYVNIDNVDDFTYRFDVNGQTEAYKIDESNGTGFVIQNQLKEGCVYDIKVNDGYLTSVVQKDTGDETKTDTVIKGNPGEKTLKNFLTTALMPVGRTLYIYGGGWNWQDDGAGVQARSIGVSRDWFRFFDSKDAGYTYKDKDGNADNADAASSYYPYGRFNEYYYAGLDCSGFLGWTLYNTFETENGKDGYVFISTENSKRLADRGWGTFRRVVPDTWHRDEDSVHPGDIISVKGHVWISLGTCKDGSVVMVHSSPSFSREGQPGGGVQIAALGDDKNCRAYGLAREYMSQYYPEWYKRYEADLKAPELYFDFENEQAGIFSWHTDGTNGVLSDPEDIKNMDPVELLKVLFDD